jgi:hypothetical protein
MIYSQRISMLLEYVLSDSRTGGGAAAIMARLANLVFTTIPAVMLLLLCASGCGSSPGMLPAPDGVPVSGDDSQALRWGYVDESGKFQILPRFDSAGPFLEGTAVVTLRDWCGIIDQAGQYVVLPQSADRMIFVNGVARGGTEETPRYFDRHGVGLSPEALRVRMAGYWDTAYVNTVDINDDGEAEIYDAGGNLFTEHPFDQSVYLPGFRTLAGVERAEGGMAWVLLDGHGVSCNETPYDAMSWLNSNIVGVKTKTGLCWTLLDDQGKPLLSTTYSRLETLSVYRGYAYVVFSDTRLSDEVQEYEWGVVDIKGTVILPAEYDTAILCDNDKAALQKSGSWRLYDLKHKADLGCVLDDVVFPQVVADHLLTVVDGEYRYVNTKDGSFVHGFQPKPPTVTDGFRATRITLELEHEMFVSACRKVAAAGGYKLRIDERVLALITDREDSVFSIEYENTSVFDAIAILFGRALPLDRSPLVIEERDGTIEVNPSAYYYQCLRERNAQKRLQLFPSSLSVPY